MLTENSVSTTNWYTWTVPDAPIQVRIPLLLIHELSHRLDKPADSEDGYARESGLLIGKAPRPGITQVTGFHPVPELGPPTVLEALTKNKGAFIGFYRTVPAGALSLTPDDRLLAEAYFHQPSSVILLIETGPVGVEEAAFFIWRNGRIDSAPARTFPFDAYQLAGGGRPAISEPMPPPTPRPAPSLPRTERPRTPEPQDRTPEPVKRTPVATDSVVDSDERIQRQEKRPNFAKSLISHRKFRLYAPYAIGALLAVILAWGSYLGLRRFKSQHPPQTATASSSGTAELSVPLGLSADRSGSVLMLSWNVNSPVILSGRGAVVQIQDGSESREIALTVEQLRSGRVPYTPTADHVTIRLKVTGPGDEVAGDLMSVFLPHEISERPLVLPRQAERSAVASRASEDAPADERKTEPRRPFSAPSGVTPARKAAPMRLDEPPVITLTPRGVPAEPIFSPPAPVPPAVASPQIPKTPAQSAQAAAQPAVAIQQALPRFPEPLKNMLNKPSAVEVAVNIDVEGKVVKAEATGSDAHVLLKQAAVDAARKWRFRPATVNGKPVPSNAVLKFNFTPKN
jgi:protein TonB